jgi:AraC-like DNA-binding protein/mannose-6-phosphate isomerase-like protein (cupin superfamily)
MRVIQERVVHPDASFRFMHLALEQFNGERHRHPQVELTWIVRGGGVRFVGDNAAPFEPGDLVLVGPNIPHLWVSHLSEVGQPHECMVVQFPAELLQCMQIPECRDVADLMRKADHGLLVHEPARSAVQALLLRMPSANGLVRMGLLLQILGVMVSSESCLQPLSAAGVGLMGARDQGQMDRRIDRVVRWIQSHHAGHLQLEDAAALVHVSPAAFSRFFKRSIGKTFTEYVNDLRCTEAAIQLRKTDKPVSQVAQDCGFQTLSHFNRQFLLRYGQSPRLYRKA